MIEKTICIDDVVVRINSSDDIYIESDLEDYDLFYGLEQGEAWEITCEYRKQIKRPINPRWNERFFLSNKHRRTNQ